MDLIDRHALLKNIYDNPPEKERIGHAAWYRKCIYEAPAIEAEPVRHGRWTFYEQKNAYLWKCSKCKGNFEQQFSYCPYCGARMDDGRWGYE